MIYRAIRHFRDIDYNPMDFFYFLSKYNLELRVRSWSEDSSSQSDIIILRINGLLAFNKNETDAAVFAHEYSLVKGLETMCQKIVDSDKLCIEPAYTDIEIPSELSINERRFCSKNTIGTVIIENNKLIVKS